MRKSVSHWRHFRGSGIQLGTGYFFVFQKVACPLSGALSHGDDQRLQDSNLRIATRKTHLATFPCFRNSENMEVRLREQTDRIHFTDPPNINEGTGQEKPARDFLPGGDSDK